jgi:hypothetical protein
VPLLQPTDPRQPRRHWPGRTVPAKQTACPREWENPPDGVIIDLGQRSLHFTEYRSISWWLIRFWQAVGLASPSGSARYRSSEWAPLRPTGNPTLTLGESKCQTQASTSNPNACKTRRFLLYTARTSRSTTTAFLLADHHRSCRFDYGHGRAELFPRSGIRLFPATGRIRSKDNRQSNSTPEHRNIPHSTTRPIIAARAIVHSATH